MKKLVLALALLNAAAADDGGCCDDPIPVAPPIEPGALILSELMADPASNCLEWFELYNRSGAELGLKNLALRVGAGSSQKSFYITRDTRLKAGEFYVVCIGYPNDSGGTSFCDYYWPTGASVLGNSGTTVTLEHSGKVIDRFTYTAKVSGWYTITDGVSIQRSQDTLNQAQTLDGAVVLTDGGTPSGPRWCNSTTSGKDACTSKGTPGEANTNCGGAATSCGCTFQRGDLLISEIMYNPSGSIEEEHEYFAIYNNTSQKVSLKGLCLNAGSDISGGKDPFEVSSDVWLDPKQEVVVGEGVASGKDGGLPQSLIRVLWTGMPVLPNSGSNTTIKLTCTVAGKAQDVAIATYTGTNWPTSTDGVSIQLDKDFLAAGDYKEAESSDRKQWCLTDATQGSKYDGKNIGTPNAANLDCSGVLPPTGKCKDSSGTYIALVPPKAADLLVTEVFQDPSGANDYKQWLELRNKGTALFHVNGLKVKHFNESGNAMESTLISETCLVVSPGKYYVMGSSANSTDKTKSDYNGGVALDYTALKTTFLYVSGNAFSVEVQDANGVSLHKTSTMPKATTDAATCLDEALNKWAANTHSSIFDGKGSPGSSPCKHQ